MPRVTFGTFSLDAPSSWSLSSVILGGPLDDAASGMLSTKEVQPFQRNMITTLEEVGGKETAESYLQRQIKGLRDANVSRQQIGKVEHVALKDGLKGLLTEQIILGHGGERVRQMQLVVIFEGVAHTTICSHLDGVSFDRVREEFRQMLLSFGIAKKG